MVQVPAFVTFTAVAVGFDDFATIAWPNPTADPVPVSEPPENHRSEGARFVDAALSVCGRLRRLFAHPREREEAAALAFASPTLRDPGVKASTAIRWGGRSVGLLL